MKLSLLADRGNHDTAYHFDLSVILSYRAFRSLRASAPSSAIHGDCDLCTLEHTGEVMASELAALVGVEYFRAAVSGQRFIQGLDAEPAIHGVRQSPCEDATCRPVHDCNEIQEPTLNRYAGYVRTPDLIGPVDHHVLRQIWINPVSRMGITGSWGLIDCFQSHQTHLSAYPVAANANAFAL